MPQFATNRMLRGLVIVAGAALAQGAQGGGVLFVDDDASPGGDGLEWATAYRFLQDALADAAGSGGMINEIRVAGGTYLPDRDELNPDGMGDRAATFELINGVALGGGFAGLGAPDPDARDIELFETVLSGDLLGNDGPNFENNEENSFLVVTGSEIDQTTTIEGFTLTGGTFGDQNPGAGMFLSSGSPTVTRCTFSGNTGAGMFNDFFSSPQIADCTFSGNIGPGMFNCLFSNPLVTNCSFRENRASSGGGMANRQASPTVTGCTFDRNHADVQGGGMFNLFSSPMLTSCTFTGNSAFGGGGISNFAGSDPNIADCTFTANNATQGGAICNSGSSPLLTDCAFEGNTALLGGAMANTAGNATLTSCTFEGNDATVDRDTGAGGLGGGVFYLAGSSALINCVFINNSAEALGGGVFGHATVGLTVGNCTFSNNVATSGGGMANIGFLMGMVTNCAFSGNMASQNGGGMYNANLPAAVASDLKVTNCTFSGNAAEGEGGGIFSTDELGGHVVVEIANCVIYANSGRQVVSVGGASTTAAYCNVEGGFPGTGNIDADPLFVDPLNGDYHLLPGSPCIDAADNTAVPGGVTTDLDGNARFLDDPYVTDTGNRDGINPIVDMGAYELCLWDCGGDHDGNVGIEDFLALLAQWQQVGTTCDFGLGPAGVGINEFLELLANWGPCL